ncbi:Galactinol synthase 4 [Forsythia ovata]|uniref:Hexosyltransferase n=1 Tax=Forsythia ovata TaxID=205694 RepID=A0ABD1WE47_9LAMI
MAPEVPVDVGNGKIPTGLEMGYSKKGYVTFLAGTGDYVKGVVGLAKGLRKVKSAYPLVVAILPDVPEEHREILRAQGCIVQEIEPIYPPDHQIQFSMAYYVINYSKLRIWNFLEYSKMVYLDADIEVYENIDHLLDTPNGYFYAPLLHSFPLDIANSAQIRLLGLLKWDPLLLSYFNAGMFVYEPSKLTYESLLETLKITPPTPFAEQDFLNMFFQKVYKPIPLLYNLVLAMLWRHPENVELEKVKVVHYCAAGSKPWRFTGQEANMDREDIKMLVKKWWDVYNDASLDYNAEESTAAEEETFSKPSILSAMPEPAVSYIPAPSAA